MPESLRHGSKAVRPCRPGAGCNGLDGADWIWPLHTGTMFPTIVWCATICQE